MTIIDNVLLFSVPVGLAVGLLVNYLADVLPVTRRLSKPAWLPLNAQAVGNYFYSPRKFVVHLIFLLAAIFAFSNPPREFAVWTFLVILIYFAMVAVIDIEHRIVMRPVSFAGAVIMGAIGIWRHGLVLTLIGAGSAFTVMLALYFAGDMLGRGLARLRKQRWQETALGFGDVNLAAVTGLLMGWPGGLVALAIGIALAGVYSLVFVVVSLVRGKYELFASIPYAPFLCIATVALVASAIYS